MTIELPRRDGASVAQGDRGRPAEEGGEPAAPAAAEGKKERVLHTRVPAVLEQELKRFAENLRIPVSNLVRTILEDALDVAEAATENVETRLQRAAHQLGAERARFNAGRGSASAVPSKAQAEAAATPPPPEPDPLRDVFAFQPVTLARASACARCKVDLPPGTPAHLGLTDTPADQSRPRLLVCADCLPASSPDVDLL